MFGCTSSCRPVLAVIGPQWSCWTFEKCLLQGLPGSNCPSGVFTCVSLTSALSYSPPPCRLSGGRGTHCMSAWRHLPFGLREAPQERSPACSGSAAANRLCQKHLLETQQFASPLLRRIPGGGWGGAPPALSLSGSSDVTGGRRQI